MPPNIILILTDHFRRDALGPFTPNLIALANQGVRFANAYCAAPLCQPARTSLITGKYPSQTGVCGNQSPPISHELRDSTLMHALQQRGYFTALIGKHHYIDRYGIGMDVKADDDEIHRYGFDHVFQVVDDSENIHNHDEYTRYLDEKGLYEEFKRVFKTHANACKPHPFAEDDTADGFIGRNGVDFIVNYAQDKPFYLNLSFIGPHPPYWHPGEVTIDSSLLQVPLGVPDDPVTRERRAHYTEKLRLIDRCVGRLVDALRRRGMLENTVICFTSDHGDMLGDFGIWDKRHFYEASVGVPLLITGPGIPAEERMNGPRISRLLASHLDLYATILGLAGDPLPFDHTRAGIDLLAALRGQTAGHAAIFAELATCVMVRTPGWKMVFDPEQGGVVQLFNLHTDLKELMNLAGTAGYETISRQLVEMILAHRIRLTQYTQIKEEQRLQKARASS
jgi:choline-sulfatase